MTRRYIDERGKVTALTIRGGDGSSLGVAERFLSGDLSFSTSQIGQLSLNLRDDGDRYPILDSGLFEPSNGNGASLNDGAVDLDDLRFTLATVGTSPAGRDVTLTAQARAHGGVRMTANTDASTLTNIDPAEWVRRKAESLGLRTVVKPSGQVWAQVGNESGKDSWTTATKLAKDLGYWCFEAAGALYFGPPTWLVGQTPRRSYTWSQRPVDDPNYDDPLLSRPTFRRVGDPDVGVSGTTVSLVLRDTENDLLPGMGLDLAGVPRFGGLYIVTDVKVPLAPGAKVSVTAEVPVDPPPGDNANKFVRSEALENIAVTTGNGTTTRTPAAGRYGGTSFNASQVGLAAGIVQACLDKRVVMPRAAILSLMCAIQESSLRNLKLNQGDRDSVGLFQQRPSQGWGTPAQLNNVATATGKFLDDLIRRTPGYPTIPVARYGAAIQATQRSGHPEKYDQHRDEAEALLAAILVTGSTTTSAAAASAPAAGGGQVERFVQLCLRQAGDTYRFGAEVRLSDPDPDTFDCSELVEWACYQVGVRIADGSQNQRRACRGFRSLTIAQARATRGALLFTSGHVAVSLGNGQTIEAKGRKYGVVVDVVGTRFVDAGLIPGMAGYVVKG